ncbi:MAG: N-acetyltransferase [archaeon]
MIRKARMADAKKIKGLLSSNAKKGLLLDKSLFAIFESIRDFFVAEQDGKFVGCCALRFCWNDLTEIRSLAVKEKFQRNGIGRELVSACLEEAKFFGAKKAFTLTFAPEFFKKIGFAEIKKEKLPHKIWSDCLNCPNFPNCKEKAMEIRLK